MAATTVARPIQNHSQAKDIQKQKSDIEESRRRLDAARSRTYDAMWALKRAEKAYTDHYDIAHVAAELAMMPVKTLVELCGSSDLRTIHDFQDDSLSIYEAVTVGVFRFRSSSQFWNSRYGQYLSHVYRNKLCRADFTER